MQRRGRCKREPAQVIVERRGGAAAAPGPSQSGLSQPGFSQSGLRQPGFSQPGRPAPPPARCPRRLADTVVSHRRTDHTNISANIDHYWSIYNVLYFVKFYYVCVCKLLLLARTTRHSFMTSYEGEPI